LNEYETCDIFYERDLRDNNGSGLSIGTWGG
jgi:hypothetical protein